jgi:hypothetical protein
VSLKAGIIPGDPRDVRYAGYVVAQVEGENFTVVARPALDSAGRVQFTEVVVLGTGAGIYGTPDYDSFVTPTVVRAVPLPAIASWVADHKERFAGLGHPLPVIAKPGKARAVDKLEGSGSQPPMRIAGAKKTRKPPGFYEAVAKAYRWLVANGEPPAATIARVNGVTGERVHQWIKRCRRDGLLGPAVTGRAGT